MLVSAAAVAAEGMAGMDAEADAGSMASHWASCHSAAAAGAAGGGDVGDGGNGYVAVMVDGGMFVRAAAAAGDAVMV